MRNISFLSSGNVSFLIFKDVIQVKLQPTLKRCTFKSLVIPPHHGKYTKRYKTQTNMFTFLAFSSSFTVMLPVPGPTSRTTSVGRNAAWKTGNVVAIGQKRLSLKHDSDNIWTILHQHTLSMIPLTISGFFRMCWPIPVLNMIPVTDDTLCEGLVKWSWAKLCKVTNNQFPQTIARSRSPVDSNRITRVLQ